MVFLDCSLGVNQSKLMPELVHLQSSELGAAIEAKEAPLLGCNHEPCATPPLSKLVKA